MSLKYQVVYNIKHHYIQYYLYGVVHRIDAPAMVWGDGDMYWFEYRQLHRINGPAVVYKNGKKVRWVRGILQSDTV